MNFYLNTLGALPITLDTPYSVSWTAPSNIALIKYWGKHGKQLPCNASLSFSLCESTTTTRITFKPSKSLKVFLNFQGKENEKFRERLEKFFSSLGEITHFFKNMEIDIDSSNTFPHSTGIASSASSLASIALCVSSLIYKVTEKEIDESFYRLSSFFARLGSGSAARSVYGNYSIWGHTNVLASNDEYAIQYKDFDPIFSDLCDAIFIVSDREKRISSSVGHGLMSKNPYADIRYANAQKNISKILDAMKKGSAEAFFAIIEQEAMELHAMMMVSNPPYLLLEPNTISIINKIKEFREATGLPVGYTIDAGPNIHFLYFSKDSKAIKPLIDELKSFCQDGRVIFDKLGGGPVKNEVR
jgi:diphosphomevalonate decarboxylase